MTASLAERVVADAPRLSAFIRDGRLTRIPRRPAIAALLYAAVAAALPRKTPMSETEVNNLLREIYDDVPTLRRALVDHGHLWRSADSQRYERRA